MTAGELARRLGGRVEGEPSRELLGMADLREAGPDQLAFLANPRYRAHLSATRAGAVLVAPGVPVPEGVTAIRVPDPYVAFARAMALFHPQSWPEPGVDPGAHVHPTAELGAGVHVEPGATVGAGARLGAGCWIQACAVVGAGARLGPRCRLMPTAVVMDGCVLGEGVWLNPGAVVGAEGFGFAPTPAGHVKIPQAGRAVVEDGVELGANTCVDRAALGETRVGAGTRTDNLCQVGHAARLGPDNLLVAYAGVAGSTRTGRGVVLAARTSLLGHLEVGEGTRVAAHAMVTRSTPPGARLGGAPATEVGLWRRSQAALRSLPEALRALRRLERRVAELERRLAGDAEGDP